MMLAKFAVLQRVLVRGTTGGHATRYDTWRSGTGWHVTTRLWAGPVAA